MKIQSIVESLRIDAKVDLKHQLKVQREDSSLTDSQSEAFATGYAAAESLLLEKVTCYLEEHFTDLSQLARPPTYPHGRHHLYRSEPEDWIITECKADQLAEEIHERARHAVNPTVVFDLDGTLVDVSYRTLGILKEWLTQLRTDEIPEYLRVHLAKLDLTHLGYSLAQAFENSGLNLTEEDVARAFHSAEAYWQKRFFDGKALVEFDRPIPGAPQFVWRLLRSGISIVYLTGRSHQNMRTGSLAQLSELGFPTLEAQLILKKGHNQDDHAFKSGVIANLSSHCEIVANFENEYVNLQAMSEYLKGNCLNVIVDSQHSGRPLMHQEPLKSFRITNFLP